MKIESLMTLTIGSSYFYCKVLPATILRVFLLHSGTSVINLLGEAVCVLV